MTDPRPEPEDAASRTRRPWPAAAWVAVPVLAGLVQLIRGEAGDAVIFLVPAFLLAADAADALPRPAAASPRVRRLLPAATIVVGVVLALAQRHSLADGTAVALLGIAVLVSAWPDPAPRTGPPPAVLHRSASVWATLAVTLAAWELLSFLLGLPSATATITHPAISDLLDPVANTSAGRLLLVAAWMLAGLGLLRRGWR